MDEAFSLSINIELNKTPLSELWMCFGTQVCVDFATEGFGKNAVETELKSCIVTKKGEYKYTMTYSETPKNAGLTPDFYEVAGVVNVGSVIGNVCSEKILGYGYIGEFRFQVYV